MLAASLGATLKLAREVRTLSAVDAARAAGISAAYLSKLENDAVKRPSRSSPTSRRTNERSCSPTSPGTAPAAVLVACPPAERSGRPTPGAGRYDRPATIWTLAG